jgi:glycosyltransferase involved in cell wall biosynthesis
MDSSAHHRSPFTLALSIVVVSADSGVALRECVRSVLAGTLPLELILIDNDSHDGVPEAIERAYAHDHRL